MLHPLHCETPGAPSRAADTFMRYRYHTLDVFTDRMFGGNPLAVFPQADGLSTDVMAAIARELNLSETVFMFPAETADGTRKLRIFTPGAELPFAGHPTLGAAHLLAATGGASLAGTGASTARIVFEEGVGPVAVTVRAENGVPVFAQLAAAIMPEVGPRPPSRERLARILGLEIADILTGDWAPAAVSCGVPFLFVPLASRRAVARARLDQGAWVQDLSSYWAPHIFVFSRDGELAGSDLHGRMFAPAMGITEDPATGAAATALGGYLASRSPQHDGTLRWTLEQGFEMGRPSLLYIEADVAGRQPQAIRVGGRSVMVGEGFIDLPDEPAPAATG